MTISRTCPIFNVERESVRGPHGFPSPRRYLILVRGEPTRQGPSRSPRDVGRQQAWTDFESTLPVILVQSNNIRLTVPRTVSMSKSGYCSWITDR